MALTVFACLSAGCSSLFYYPTHTEYLSEQQINRKTNLQVRDVWFHASDGTKLHGWYVKSKLAPTRVFMVFFHGNAQNLTAHFLNMAWAAKYGVSYMIFDYRGYGQSSGSPSPRGTVLDGVAALKWGYKKEKSFKKHVPFIVFAQSLGGIIALESVLQVKGKIPIDQVIVESTFLSYIGEARAVMDDHWFLWPFQWLPYLVLSDKWAPDRMVKEISPIPLVVIQGDKDPTVPYRIGKQVYTDAASPKKFWRVRGGGHTGAFWGSHAEKFRTRFLKQIGLPST